MGSSLVVVGVRHVETLRCVALASNSSELLFLEDPPFAGRFRASSKSRGLSVWFGEFSDASSLFWELASRSDMAVVGCAPISFLYEEQRIEVSEGSHRPASSRSTVDEIRLRSRSTAIGLVVSVIAHTT
jgi:hypothetical protein